jgi:hypothetical protein
VSVPRLAQLQRDFLAALVTGDNARAEALVRPGRSAAARRIDIYRNNVRSNWRGALQAAYPVVAALVGESFFAEAADRFADAEPSRSGDLHRFGPGFAAFLAAYAHAAGLAYLPDVARLEWAWHEAFHAAEHDSLDFALLAAVAPERYGKLRFGLHPSARLVRSDFPVLSIWNAHQPGADGECRVDPGAAGERVLVFRGDLETRLFALDETGWSFLAGLARGASLDEVAAAPELAGDAGFLGEALRRWAGEGVIVSFSLPAGGRQDP